MNDKKSFVNEFHLDSNLVTEFINNEVIPTCNSLLNSEDLSLELKGLLDKKEVIDLISELDKQTWVPVGLNGMLSGYTDGDEIGSYRLSLFEKRLSLILWNRIKYLLPIRREFTESSLTDWDGHSDWVPVGINPLFRFIRYTDKGLLVPHYDGSYVEDEDTRSLSSLVIYLEGNDICGATRFIKDNQEGNPVSEWDFSDWPREATQEEVIKKIYGDSGNAILFDHWILHDSEKMIEGRKTIIRTDIMYKKLK
jgi:hypothetical protein